MVTDACAATSSESEKFIIDGRLVFGIGDQLEQGEIFWINECFQKISIVDKWLT